MMKPSHILAALLCWSQDVMDAVVADETPRDLVSLTLMNRGARAGTYIEIIGEGIDTQ
jgi:hypothetical protein